MKILVFSDTHLGLKFENKKFEFLKKIISQTDQVIINGDFWEGYIINFDDFIKSDWKKLFPLLKRKNAVYIFGNHDKKTYVDKRVNLFSTKQTDKFNLKIDDKLFIFEHGHNISSSLADKFLPGKKIKLYSTILSDFFEEIVVRFFKNKFIRSYCQIFNQMIKNKIKKESTKKHFYVCGHTHFKEIDWENNFINSGIIRFGLAQYINIIDGKVFLEEKQYD